MKKTLNKSISNPWHDTEKKDNKIEAKTLIAYVRETYKKPKLALSVLDSILINNTGDFQKEHWDITKFIAARTSYVSIEEDYDIDYEEGDWGTPVMAGGQARPIRVDISDRENLILLGRELDRILNRTVSKKISNFVSQADKPKWKCQKCGRFLGKELSSVDEVKQLLRDFSIGKYHKCRSCSTNNYFAFNSDGIVFHSKSLD
jgi:hypothetical protein